MTDTAERAQTRRVVLVVGTIIVALTLVALIVPHLVAPRGFADRPTYQQPVPIDEPVEEYGPAQEEFLPPPPGCPSPEPVPPGTGLDVMWAPVVTALGRSYMGSNATGLVPGEEVATITCDILAISGGGRAMVPTPWPDGSSTILGAGTVVRAIQGVPAECYVMADDGHDQWLFEAIDEDGGLPTECLAVPHPGP